MVLRAFIRFWLWASGLKISAEGIENLGDGRGLILVSNHQSLIDPLVMMTVLKIPFRIVITEAIFKVPVPTFNYLISEGGFVPILGTLKSNLKKSIDSIVDIVKNGDSILMFAEGITSRDGSIGRFKWGVSQIALYSGNPVVPVALNGCFKTFPPISDLFIEAVSMTKAGGSRLGMLYAFIRVLLIMLFGFTPHSIKIKFGKPIKFDEYKKADLDAFREIAEKLQGEVQSLLSSIRCPS